MSRAITVCHIDTAAGARFSIHPDAEDLRTSLIEYFNEVLLTDEEDPLADDATLEEVTEAIEEMENVSTETIHIDPEEFWS